MIIKPADQGGKIVLWPTQLYIEEANRQLGDNDYYQEQIEDKTPALSIEIQYKVCLKAMKNFTKGHFLSQYKIWNKCLDSFSNRTTLNLTKNTIYKYMALPWAHCFHQILLTYLRTIVKVIYYRLHLGTKNPWSGKDLLMIFFSVDTWKGSSSQVFGPLQPMFPNTKIYSRRLLGTNQLSGHHNIFQLRGHDNKYPFLSNNKISAHCYTRILFMPQAAKGHHL